MTDTGALQPRPTVHLSGRTQTLQRGAQIERERPRVDVVIVFDTTGSMSRKREALIDGMSEFVSSLDGYQLDWRVSVLPFGDLTIPGDRIVGELPFVSTTDAAVAQLVAMPAFSGGSNGGESSIEAMRAALAKTWRARALKIMLLLTDDHALDSQNAPVVTARLLASDTLCFTAAIDTPYYREWASATGGTWTAIGAGYNTDSIHEVLRSLLRQVASTAATVHRLALGSPERLRALGSAPRS